MKLIIQKLGMLIAMLSAFLSASAYDFEVDGICYDITSFNSLTVTASAVSEKATEEIIIPDNVTFSTKTLTVTQIGDNFAKDNTKITTVIIGDGISEIGSYAFYGCSKLEKIKLSKRLSVIPAYCFFGCSNLQRIELPQECKSINNNAFANSGLISFDTGNITFIGDSAFFDCLKLETFTIGRGIKEISNLWFNSSTQIKTLTLAESDNVLTFKIGLKGGLYFEYDGSRNKYEMVFKAPLFQNLPLETVVINRSLAGYYSGIWETTSYKKCTYIPTPFIEHPTLKNVIIGGKANSLSSSGSYIKNCEITSSDSEETKAHCKRNVGPFEKCINLRTLSFESKEINQIHCRTFSDCTNLETVNFSDEIQFIGNNCFFGCSSLKKIIAVR